MGGNSFFFRRDEDLSSPGFLIHAFMQKLLEGLNPAQKEAVAYDGGPLLVLAGAGSGKTRVLTHRAAWLVASGKVKPDQLLLLTFTNKAAGEMKERLVRLLSSLSVSGMTGLFAGTFHSFCAYLLRREGSKIGIKNTFVIFDDVDQKSLLRNIFKRMGFSEKEFKIGMVQSVIGGSKNDLIDPETFLKTSSDYRRKAIGRIYQEYEKELKKMQGLDFADLLYWAVKLFREDKDVLKKYQDRYRYILVDEYQDTNRSQYSLTKLLSERYQNLTAVGDIAQSIYMWRGADYRNLLILNKDFPKIKTINLNINYRSTQNILDVAYGVISKNQKHPTLKLMTKNGRGEKIVVYQGGSEVDEAKFVADRIKTLTDFEGIDPAKIAVLYRTNAQSRILEEVFIRQGLPYVLIGGVRFYDRAEVKDVLSLLRVVYNPKDLISWQRIEKNFGKRRMERARLFLEGNKQKKWKTKKLLEEILAASGYLEKFNPDDEGDAKRLENIKELLSVAEKFPQLGNFLENIALVQQEYSAQEKEKKNWKNEAIKLMTLHASKGLEFEAVFLVGMEEGLLPHSRNIDDLDRLEEERRLCYVGITRAKKKLFLTFACQRLYFGRTNHNEPSRFLADVPENLLEFKGGEADIELDDGWGLDEEW